MFSNTKKPDMSPVIGGYNIPSIIKLHVRLCSLHVAGLVIQISFTAYVRLFARYNSYPILHHNCHDRLAARALDTDRALRICPHVKQPAATAGTFDHDSSLSLIHTMSPPFFISRKDCDNPCNRMGSHRFQLSCWHRFSLFLVMSSPLPLSS